MIDIAIKKLVKFENIDQETAYNSMIEIMDGQATQSMIAAFLVALRMKGETVDEIYGCAKAMKDKALQVHTTVLDIVDTCGTGGDSSNTFNISTTAMFIAAACGVKIAKHGNRSITSKSGAADVLESLGINIQLTHTAIAKSIEEIGLGFMFAPMHHMSTKHAMPIRKELGIRTIFNILGPLANPASAKRQVIGVFDKNLVRVFAEVLHKLGTTQAMIVHGEDGLDEITLTGKTYVAELKAGEIKEYTINPTSFGMKLCKKEEIHGGTPEENANILKDVLRGKKGPKLDISILNAAAAIYIAGISKDLGEGIKMAMEVIENNKAIGVLEKLIEFSNKNISAGET